MLIRLSLLNFGLMAGFFYAYSVTVMPGLDDSAPETAVAAMQGINRVVRNPVFFATFFGGAFLPLLAGVVAYMRGQGGAAALIGVAGVAYLLGVVVFTAQIHVPMNDALAQITAPASSSVWANYAPDWTFWNHVRGGICLVCLALSAEALRRA